jgi:hypothetical protein
MADAPVKSLLRSRKFLLAVFGLIQTIVAFYLELPPEMWISINGLIAILIGSIAYEDGQEKNASDVYVGGEPHVRPSYTAQTKFDQ